MPFQCVQDCDIRKLCQFNSSVRHSNAQIINLISENHKLSNSVQILQSELQKTQCSPETSEVSKTQCEPTAVENTSHDHEKLQKEVEDLRQKLESSLDDNDYLYYFFKEMHKNAVRDIEHLSTYISRMFLHFNPLDLPSQEIFHYTTTQGFDCKNCGSKKFHMTIHCAAIGILEPCGYCKGKEHLSP